MGRKGRRRTARRDAGAPRPPHWQPCHPPRKPGCKHPAPQGTQRMEPRKPRPPSRSSHQWSQHLRRPPQPGKNHELRTDPASSHADPAIPEEDLAGSHVAAAGAGSEEGLGRRGKSEVAPPPPSSLLAGLLTSSSGGGGGRVRGSARVERGTGEPPRADDAGASRSTVHNRSTIQTPIS
uniref:Uncharacterized protein n=1 Tax=Setaria viridis TaxID=4556 RepID=A0A4U6VJM2_SETVI|nr:hypothetical protein SEVIR_3G422300v2 [Setaria viridis]